ncbi:transcriptional regulator [Campylobacter pinnipediorum subsp. caledonicus]|uniref:XRE family transcriptional regulator n=1 Tax=Campylobacter pinnipediorum TaxID=1965231 RepID=UPI000994F7F2|nr:LexA family transcriptional regulator [Campylobacter pinnipediorum]OPA71855.1 transcriptional regulator [Campylobacter pinnipediorum subsp. caledonicus]
MSLSNKIKKARKQANLTQLQLSKLLGINRASITQYETDVAIPPVATLKLIADACGVAMTFFFDDELEINRQIVKQELKNNFAKYADLIPSQAQIKNTVFLPKSEMVIGAGAEGTFDLSLFESETRIAVDKKFIKGLNPANLKLFEVVGDSMYPEYDEGDLAIVDMVNHRYDFIKIAGIYIVRVGDVVYIKRVEFLPENAVKLISLNSKYGDMYPHKDGYECEILGKVCGKIKFEISKGLTFSDSGIK